MWCFGYAAEGNVRRRWRSRYWPIVESGVSIYTGLLDDTIEVS
jgi:hypothetical protein